MTYKVFQVLNFHLNGQHKVQFWIVEILQIKFYTELWNCYMVNKNLTINGPNGRSLHWSNIHLVKKWGPMAPLD